MIPATWNEVSSWTQLKHHSNSFPYFILLQQKTHSALFGLGFASVHSFPCGQNLRETAGLDSDPCTCSCEKPMQGYLGCVYMQILISSRQLSHHGQWTVKKFVSASRTFFLITIILTLHAAFYEPGELSHLELFDILNEFGESHFISELLVETGNISRYALQGWSSSHIGTVGQCEDKL